MEEGACAFVLVRVTSLLLLPVVVVVSALCCSCH